MVHADLTFAAAFGHGARDHQSGPILASWPAAHPRLTPVQRGDAAPRPLQALWHAHSERSPALLPRGRRPPEVEKCESSRRPQHSGLYKKSWRRFGHYGSAKIGPNYGVGRAKIMDTIISNGLWRL